MAVRATLAAVVLWAISAAARAEPLPEYQVKAAFLYKFGSFVEWPPGAFHGPNAPLVVCVIGKDPFGPALDRLAAGQAVGGRPVQIQRLPLATAETRCHIAFLGGGGQPVAEAARLLKGRAVLTVADGGDSPAAIGFVIVQSRVRFRIHPQRAADGGMTISSKLLNLAVGSGR